MLYKNFVFILIINSIYASIFAAEGINQKDSFLSPYVTNQCLKENNFKLKDIASNVYDSYSHHPITIFEGNINIATHISEIKERIIYGKDVSQDEVGISAHAEAVCSIFPDLAPTAKLLFTSLPEEIIKFNSNIINISCGCIDDNEILTDNTEKFLCSIYNEGFTEYKKLLKAYFKDPHANEMKNHIKAGLADEYFLYKYSDLLIKLANKGKTFNEFISEIKNKLTEIYHEDQFFLTSNFLNGKFLTIHSLENKLGILSSQNCSFTINKNSEEKKYIIFVKNLFYSVKNGGRVYLPKESQTPSHDFADRTICVVLPVKYEDLSDDLNNISSNSLAAPWVTSCAYHIYNLVEILTKTSLSPDKLSECILETARAKFADSPADKVFIKGKAYSLTYGVGILDVNAALDYVKKLYCTP